MTDINPTNKTDQSFATLNPKISKSKATDAFENALTKALDKTEAPEMEHTSTNALSEIASKGLNIINSSAIVSGQTDKLLEMLDSYSSKLEDPSISLKSIAPILEEIKHTAGTLLKETEKLTGTDDSLKKIAAQTILLAQTEDVKFQRGDYLS